MWDCGKCSATNWDDASVCFKCRTSKPASLSAAELSQRLLPTQLAVTPQDEEIASAFRQYLTQSDRLSIYPAIAQEWLDGAHSTYFKPRNAEFLIAIYDSTWIMRHAKDGIAFTTQRLYWHDASDAGSINYAALPNPIWWTEDTLHIGQKIGITFFDSEADPVFSEAFWSFYK